MTIFFRTIGRGPADVGADARSRTLLRIKHIHTVRVVEFSKMYTISSLKMNLDNK